jgi:NAD(P)-dependent dehydrogenase (short-subunit alcohol dehydrogenase family)
MDLELKDKVVLVTGGAKDIGAAIVRALATEGAIPAAELADYRIRVNAIVPAEVMTPLDRQWLDRFQQPEEKLKCILAKILLQKRMTTPEEIAAYVHLDRART